MKGRKKNVRDSDSYSSATSNIDAAATIAEELRENYDDDYLAEDYNYEEYE